MPPVMGDEITLYHPGDGVTKESNSTTYRGIKEFKNNGNGTITFKTKKFGTITTPLYWRLKQGVALKDDEAEAPAGNQAHNNNNHW